MSEILAIEAEDWSVSTVLAHYNKLQATQALLAECRNLLCQIGGIGYGVTLTEYKRKAMELVRKIDGTLTKESECQKQNNGPC